MLTELQRTEIEENLLAEGSKMFVRTLFQLEDVCHDDSGTPDTDFVIETLARMVNIALAGYGDVARIPAQDQFYLNLSTMLGHNVKN